MRIQTFKLMAFGPFTDASLDLSHGEEGLHLVYGRNEAGKSSALRALGDLLFGVPHLSNDAFVHAYKQLRLGAELQLQDGTSIELVRRKSKTKSLRDEHDDQPLDDGVLSRFLGGLDRPMFEAIHGLDHRRLVEGGELILQGGGHLGEILFAAGSGLGNVQDVERAINEQAEGLFKAQGRNPELNKKLSEYSSVRERLKQAQLKAEQWTGLQADLQRLQKQQIELDQSISERECELSRLARIRDALPLCVKRQQILQSLEANASVAPVKADFLQSVTETMTRRTHLTTKMEQLQRDIEQLQTSAQSLHIPIEVLEEETRIGELRERHAVCRKALTDRSRLQLSLSALQQKVMTLFEQLGRDERPEDIQALQISVDKSQRIHELGAKYEGLIERKRAAQQGLKRTQGTLEALEEELDSIQIPKNFADTRAAVRSLQPEIRAEEHLETQTEKIRMLDRKIEQAIKRLSSWPTGVVLPHELQPPSVETIDDHEVKLREHEQRLAILKEKCQETETTLQEITTELSSLNSQFDIPDEQALRSARQARDLQYQKLKDELADECNRIDSKRDSSETSLDRAQMIRTAESLEHAIQSTDQLSDRLRLDADRVAQKSRLSTEQLKYQNQVASVTAEIETISNERKALKQAWEREWQSLSLKPTSPTEMRSWRIEFDKIVEWDLQRLEAKQLQADMNQKVQAIHAQLAELFESSGLSLPKGVKSIAGLYEALHEFTSEQSELAQRQEQLQQSISRSKSDLASQKPEVASAESDLAEWHTAWTIEMDRLGLEDGASPSQANSVLSTLNAIQQTVHEERELEIRIAGIDRDNAAFENDLRDTIERISVAIDGQSMDEMMTTLLSRLEAARTCKEESARLRQDRADKQAEADEVDQQLAALNSKLEIMRTQLNSSPDSDLVEDARIGIDRGQFQTRLDEFDERLMTLSGGVALDEFLAALANETVTVDEIPSLIDELEETGKRLRSDRDETLRDIERVRHELSDMNGRGAAAEIAEEAEQIAAVIESQAREVAVLRMMQSILSESIKRYRDRHQDPLVQRASQLFAKLTCNHFAQLVVDFDEQGEPTIFGIREQNGEQVPVHGMSDGTRDQLFLALRIASVEQSAVRGEPMPFIMDDVLMNFDDNRSSAAFSALGELAEKTQVIMFTHHEHLVELANRSLTPGTLFTHELDCRVDEEAAFRLENDVS